MVLVDTSVWIEHPRGTKTDLGRLLANERVATHPFVIGEIALGSLRRRASILTLLDGLIRTDVASHAEVMAIIGEHDLFGSGIGYVDAHRLASVRITPNTSIWAFDRRMNAMASQTGAKLYRAEP